MAENLSVGAWIVRRATRTPDRIAVIAGERQMTYRMLGERVERLAAGLGRRGVMRGERVVIVVRNEPAALETMFACGLLGAVAVPLHADLDPRVLADQVREAGPAAVVAAPDAWATLHANGALDGVAACFVTGEAHGAQGYEALVEGSEPLRRMADVGLEDVCMWAHSSGTSGRSKAIALTHGNMLFNAFNVLSTLDYVSSDVMLTSAPLHRMGGWGFTLPMLVKGGTCVLQTRAGAHESLRLIERHRVSVLFDAVGAMQSLADAWAERDVDVSSVRICATGGTRVPAALGEAFRRRGLVLQPGYGLSEAAPLVAVVERDEVTLHPNGVGRPALFTSVRVVDASLDDVRAGEPGELLVRGLHVTPGYVDNPQATARARMPDGWFRTGDAVAMTEDGMLSVLGRVADALVVAGRTVYPEPIEEALAAEPGVAQCLLVQRAPDAEPVLWVVADNAAALDEPQLLARAREALGGTVTPQLRRTANFPRNANGKPLRNALRALDAEAA